MGEGEMGVVVLMGRIIAEGCRLMSAFDVVEMMMVVVETLV